MAASTTASASTMMVRVGRRPDGCPDRGDREDVAFGLFIAASTG
jgi:hypothetical protein